MLSDAAREHAGDGIRAQLDDLVERVGARSVSCYLSTPTEPGTRGFVDAAVRRGIRVLLPITRTDGLLDWSVAVPGGDVTEGILGMPEPVGEVLGPIAVDVVAPLIVPAAAVDSTGLRLGRGCGFVDKTDACIETCPPRHSAGV